MNAQPNPLWPPLMIGNITVKPGQRGQTELPVAKLVTGSPLSLPVIAVHGRQAGPTVWLSAAIHGDEINGVEIIRRVLGVVNPRAFRGTLLAVPVVNGQGFIAGDRYLPDRRDLNRSFPGSARGSLASRIARIFMDEIVARCTVGLDLHTGSDHRTNLPQIRADLDNPAVLALAQAFAPPVLMHASIRDGSLRGAAAESGANVLLFEGGEAWRFDQESIRVGVGGIRRVLGALDMLDAELADPPDQRPATAPLVSRASSWTRSRRSGLAQLSVTTGDHVQRGQTIGLIHDSFGQRLSQIKARDTGMIVGINLDPLVNQGDALVHIAQLTDTPNKPRTDGLPTELSVR